TCYRHRHEMAQPLHHVNLRIVKCGARARAERKGADHSPLGYQRMTAISSHAMGPNQLRAQVTRGASAFRLAVANYAPPQGPPVVEPLKLMSLFLGYAGEGIEAQTVRMLLKKEIEEKLAIESAHHHLAEFIYDGWWIVTLQKLASGFRC